MTAKQTGLNKNICSKLWRRPMVKATWLMAIAGVVAAIAACYGLIYTIQKDTESRKEAEIFQWQRTAVYNIINEKTKTGDTINFEDIKTEYVTKAGQELKVKLSKEDIQDIELKRILMTLESEKLIGHWTNYYYIHQTNPCGNELTPDGFKAQKKILVILKAEPGKYDANQLHAALESKNISLKEEEYSLVINCLISRHYVSYQMWNNKLYAVAFPPKEAFGVIMPPQAGEKLQTKQKGTEGEKLKTKP